jgi:arylsulfatase A-like enzyme
VRRCLLVLFMLACQAESPEPVAKPNEQNSAVSVTPQIPEPVPGTPGQPPIVLITLDTTRADHLGAYGYFRDTSPTLDRLAKISLVFDDAIAPMATTLPTHLSLMTGLNPLEHGTTANVMHGGTRFVPSDGVQTFAQLLQSAGYQTAGFVSAAPLKRGTGIDRGFGSFDQPQGTERSADQTVGKAQRWLQEIDLSRPWFLWIHLYDPHNPYAPIEPYRSRFVGDGDQAAWLDERGFSESSVRPGKPEPGRTAGEVVQTVPANDRYDGEIAFMDAQLAMLFAQIQSTRSKPVILVVGDHGEGLGQHDQPGHGRVWNEQLRVPMMLHIPGLASGRHAETVGVVDVIPTLLGLVPIEGDQAFLEQASGVDVLAADVPERRVLSLQSDRQVSEFGQPPTMALTSKKEKWILQEGVGVHWYDRSEDPHELQPIAGTTAQLTELERIRQGYLDRSLELGQGRAEAVSEQDLQALEALGYIE